MHLALAYQLDALATYNHALFNKWPKHIPYHLIQSVLNMGKHGLCWADYQLSTKQQDEENKQLQNPNAPNDCCCQGIFITEVSKMANSIDTLTYSIQWIQFYDIPMAKHVNSVVFLWFIFIWNSVNHFQSFPVIPIVNSCLKVELKHC